MLNKIKEWLNLNPYRSELDQFLMSYDQAHSQLSLSQQSELDKYKRIYHLRDDPHAKNTPSNIDIFSELR